MKYLLKLYIYLILKNINRTCNNILYQPEIPSEFLLATNDARTVE